MLKLRRLLASLIIIALSFAGVATVAAQDAVTPSLTIEDQDLSITVDTVVSDGPGWVVVHADDNGSPGEVIGVAAVTDGENTDVEVPLDATRITETVYVMLHTDAGTEGTFEFPDGDDAPAQADGEVVVTPITFNMPEQLPEMGMGEDDETETPEATETPEDDEGVVDDDDAAGDDDDEGVVDDDDAAGDDDDDDVVGDDDADATPEAGADDEDDDEVLPETGASLSLLPMLGLAAAGALLLGVGFVFAYRKQD